MYPQIPPGNGLVRMHFTSPGGDGHAYTLFGMSNTSSLTAAEIATATITAYSVTSSLSGFLASEAQLADVHVVLNTGGVLSEFTQAAGVAGLGPNPSVSPQVALLATKNTEVVGRKGHGRMYLPYAPNEVLDASGTYLTGSYPTEFAGACENFFDSLTTNGVIMNILHRDTAVAPTPVTALEGQIQVATQRRRNRKAAHR